MLKRFLGNERGQVIVLVVGMVAMMAVLSSATVLYARNQRIASERKIKETQAYYIADAGITKALKIIKDSGSISSANLSSLNPLNYGGGRIESVTLTDLGGGHWLLVSTGVYPYLSSGPVDFPGRRTISAKITQSGGGSGGGDPEDDDGDSIPPGGGIEPGGSDYFERGIWCDYLTVNNAARFKSSVYCTHNVNVNNSLWIGQDSKPRTVKANGTVTLQNGCKIWGNIYAIGGIDLGNGDSVSDTLKSLGSITLNNGNKVNGTVLAGGNINVVNGSNFNKLQSNGTITFTNGVTINGTVEAIGSVSMGNGGRIKSSVWTMGNLNMVNGCTIDGSAWVHGTYDLGNGGKVTGGIFHLDSMDPFDVSINPVSPVPEADIDWYRTEAQKTSGHYYSSSRNLTLDEGSWNGIYFIDGDFTISSHGHGYFSGKATFVASGNIIFPNGKNITMHDQNDSLVLISGNDITLTNGNHVDSFLWANNNIYLNNGNTVDGGIICSTFVANNAANVNQLELEKNGGGIIIESWY